MSSRNSCQLFYTLYLHCPYKVQRISKILCLLAVANEELERTDGMNDEC